LHKTDKLYAKQRGLISLYLFIPIFIALFFSVSVCFSIASKQAEFYLVRAENLAVNNIFMQAESVACDWFEKAVKSGEAELNFSLLPVDNPVIPLPEVMLKEIEKADKAYSINAYLVDENYSLSWTLRAGKLAIPKNSPAYMYKDTDNVCYTKRYMLVCELSPKQRKNSGKYVSCTELIVVLRKGAYTVQRLYSRVNYILE